jgi:UDP-2-acetamido-3-amino-2,3-dideoxy-glucuronate N-acetyltransferase
MVFTNVINPRAAINRRDQYLPTIVKKGATIGANATIVCGITIGEYAFIGAGAVVTRDVPAYALVMGNPARQKGWMSAYGHRLEFDANNVAKCPESGEEYLLEKGRVEKLMP